MNTQMAATTWRGVGLGAGVVATTLSRKAIAKGWSVTRGGEPPVNPASKQTTWGEALAYAVVTGVAVGVLRLVATRLAAEAWERFTGELPPGLEETT